MQSEQRLAGPGGEPVWVLLSVSVVNDADGRPAHRIVQLQDVSEHKAVERQLKHLADHDPLTDLTTAAASTPRWPASCPPPSGTTAPAP